MMKSEMKRETGMRRVFDSTSVSENEDPQKVISSSQRRRKARKPRNIHPTEMAPKSFKLPTPLNASKALRVSRYSLSRTGSKGARECSKDFPALGCPLRRVQ